MSTTSQALMLTIRTVLSSGFISGMHSATSSLIVLEKQIDKISKMNIGSGKLNNLAKATKDGSEEFMIFSNSLQMVGMNSNNLDSKIKAFAFNLNHLQNKAKLDFRITSNIDKIRSEVISLKATILAVTNMTALTKSSATVPQTKYKITSLDIDDPLKMMNSIINKVKKLKAVQTTLSVNLIKYTANLNITTAIQSVDPLGLLAKQISNTNTAIAQFFLPSLSLLTSTIGLLAEGITSFTEKFPIISKVVSGAISAVIAFNTAMSLLKTSIAYYQTTILNLAEAKKFLSSHLSITGLRMHAFNTMTAISNTRLKLLNITSKIFSLTIATLSKAVGLGGKAIMFLGGTFKKVSIMMMTTPLGLILGGIALVAGLIIANWDKVKVWFKSFVDWIYPIFQPVINFYKNLWGGIFDFFASKFEWLTSKISWVIDKSKKVASFLGFGADKKSNDIYDNDKANNKNYSSSFINRFDKPSNNSSDRAMNYQIKTETASKIKSVRDITITFNGDFKVDNNNGNFDFSKFKAQLIREVKTALKQDDWNNENIAFEN